METIYKVYFSDYKVLNMRKSDILNIGNTKTIYMCTKKYGPVGFSDYVKEMEIILYKSNVNKSADSYIENYTLLPGTYGLNAFDENDQDVCRFLNDEN
jgi:hypothetical protein